MKKNIKTSRLELSKPSLGDLKELYELTSKPEVNLFNPHGPDKCIEETEETLQYRIKKDWK